MKEMDERKRKKLEAAGIAVGTVQEFLGLTDAETELVDIKASLALMVADLRRRQNLTQVGFAKRLGSSQSRVAKIEGADSSVSLDLLVKSALILGASREQLGAAVLTTAAKSPNRRTASKTRGRVVV